MLLVRHGQTAGNAEGRMQPPQEPLSELGLEQARQLGRALKGREQAGEFRIVSVLCSDLHRTRETLDCALEALGALDREIAHEPLLQERNFGDIRGQLYVDVRRRLGDPLAPGFAPPGGETLAMFKARVSGAWQKMTAAAWAMPEAAPGSPENVLLVVTHGMVLKVVYDTFLGGPPDEQLLSEKTSANAARLRPAPSQLNFVNTSVTTVRLSTDPGNRAAPRGCNMFMPQSRQQGRATVESLNDASHLSAEGPRALGDPALRTSVALTTTPAAEKVSAKKSGWGLSSKKGGSRL